MSRYRGPRFKRIRCLGALSGLTSKRPRSESDLRNQSHSGKRSQYRIRLEEKHKLIFHYGQMERQLLRYVRIVGKAKGSIGQVLLQLLEMRLDNILFQLLDIPSYRCKPKDFITTREKERFRTLIQNHMNSSPNEELPKHLNLYSSQYKGLVNQIIDSKCIGLKINELLVVEYYSH
ncbi:hypothetical protein AMTRI_Chr07g26430 [Amborella trichopoda]